MKYSIKNCPFYEEDIQILGMPLSGKFNVCNLSSASLECKDMSTCLFKQVIDKCKTIQHYYSGTDNQYCLGKLSVVEEILKIFEIEEIIKDER